MITRVGHSNDYEGECSLMITRGGYSNDYEGSSKNVLFFKK